MERANAYAALVAELESWRQKSPVDLVARVGVAPMRRDIDLAGEVVSIEVSVTWTDASRERLMVEAVANGPSSWTTERLAERIVLPNPLADARGGS